MPIITAGPLVLSDQDKDELKRMARSTSLPHHSVRQAEALIKRPLGLPNEEIARPSGMDSHSVRAWRLRFEAKAPGPRGYRQGQEAAVVAAGRDGGRSLSVTLHELPPTARPSGRHALSLSTWAWARTPSPAYDATTS